MLKSEIRNSNFSLLAFIETTIASFIAIYFAYKTSFIWQFVISSLISPLFLMRSKESIALVLKKTESVFEYFFEYKTSDVKDARSAFKLLMIMGTLIPAIIITKFYKAAMFYLSNPVYSLKQIPQNFYHNIFVLNIKQSPQIVPGADEIENTESLFIEKTNYDLYGIYKELFPMIFKEIKSGTFGKTNKYFFFTVLVSFISLCLIPMTLFCFSFRYCVKSTAIVWLPLLWIMYNANPGYDTTAKMRITIYQPWFKVIVSYSIFVVLAFSFKVFLFVENTNIHLPEQIGPFQRIGEGLMDPFNIPLWQIAGFINAILALLFYNEAKRHGIAAGSSEAWAPELIKTEYTVIQSIRTTLSLYTIACFIYIIVAAGSDKEWPAIRFILFPW